MSHICQIKTVIKDLNAVRAACIELGLTFRENQKTCDFWPQSGKPQKYPCNHAIGLPKGEFAMELGLAENEDGTFSFVGDDLLKQDALKPDGTTDVTGEYWCKSIFGQKTNPLGRDFNKFIQTYAIHKATHEATAQGYIVTRQPAKEGCVNLIVTGFSETEEQQHAGEYAL